MNHKGLCIFSVDLDDWYHVGWIAGSRSTLLKSSDEAKELFVGEGLRGPTAKLLRMFKEFNVRTTFFTQGEIAQEYPDLLEAIVAEGHEVGSHDLHHISPIMRSKANFRQDVIESVAIITKVIKETPRGYRSPNGELSEIHVNTLEELGFKYDASVYPCIPIPGHYGRPFAPTQPYRPSRTNLSKRDSARGFVEFPFAVVPYLRVPGGSSWYLRNLGLSVCKLALRSQLKRGVGCFNMHPYEISDQMPSFPGLPRHVFNKVGSEMINLVDSLLRYLQSRASFVTFSECLERL
jgi:peptidoglycan/xylan/chitin deacetylase (PgdA/CDA1 family)